MAVRPLPSNSAGQSIRAAIQSKMSPSAAMPAPSYLSEIFSDHSTRAPGLGGLLPLRLGFPEAVSIVLGPAALPGRNLKERNEVSPPVFLGKGHYVGGCVVRSRTDITGLAWQGCVEKDMCIWLMNKCCLFPDQHLDAHCQHAEPPEQRRSGRAGGDALCGWWQRWHQLP